MPDDKQEPTERPTYSKRNLREVIARLHEKSAPPEGNAGGDIRFQCRCGNISMIVDYTARTGALELMCPLCMKVVAAIAVAEDAVETLDKKMVN